MINLPSQRLNSRRARNGPGWLMPLVVSLIIFGIGLRLVGLESKFYWNDEAITVLRSAGHRIWDFKGSFFDNRIIPFDEVQYFQQLKPGSTFRDTVSSLAVEDAKHTPLYFILARAWRLAFEPLFGSPIATVRALSALLSLAAFPSLYWFCRELFPESPLTAKLALGFFALSPVQLLYAQEARAYSLWVTAVILSSAALLRATRHPSALVWAGYVGTCMIGLYSQSLFVTVLLSHGCFVLMQGWLERESDTPITKLPRLWWHYLGALLAISLLFLPWLIHIFTTMSMLKATTGWVVSAMPNGIRIQRWLIALSSTFFDWDSYGWIKGSLPRMVVTAALLASMAYVCRRAKRPAWLLMLCLAAGPVVCLMLPDIFLGGQRSVAVRYWLAALVTLPIAVAYVFGLQLAAQRSLSSRFWSFLCIGVFALQLTSCLRIAQAPTWWSKSLNFLETAEIINASPKPLVISDGTGTNPGYLLALSYILDGDVDLMLVKPPEVPKLPEGYDDIFIFDTYEEPKGSLQALYGTEQPVDAVSSTEGALWKINQDETAI